MLNESHAAHLRKSAIIDAIRDARPYSTITLADIKDLLDRGFSPRQARPGILISQCDVHGENGHYQLRPDEPRMFVQKNGKIRTLKYENPKGSTNRLDVNPVCLNLLRDPNEPLWIFEGSKKLDAALSAGSDQCRCGVSIAGANNWRGTNELGGKAPLACFSAIPWKGTNGARKVLIALDYDPDPVVRAKVLHARTGLAAYLRSRGAEVWTIDVPPTSDGSKGAVDDYLASGGTIEALVAIAVRFDGPKERPAAAPITGLPPDAEIELASRFAKLHQDELLYFGKIDTWYHYDDSRGLWISDEDILKRFSHARDLARLAADEYTAAHTPSRNPDAVLGRAKSIASKSTVANIVTLARVDLAKALLDDKHNSMLDANHYLLNTPGGCVDLSLKGNGAIRKATPGDYFSKTTSVAPADKKTPDFDQFLYEIMGSDISPERCSCAACALSVDKPNDERLRLHLAEVYKLKDYTLRVYGYALLGVVKEDKLFLQIGEGGNGKGVLNDLMQYIFGLCPFGYSTEVVIEALLETKGPRAHPTELMPLLGARLAIARETSENAEWNESRVRKLTGRDPVTARGMRQNFITFAATHKLIVFGNDKPGLRSGDQNSWQRRIEMLEFQQNFKEKPHAAEGIKQADIKLPAKLLAEAPGILHKLIQACLEYQRIGLQPPATVTIASDRYLREQTSILGWIDERLDRTEKQKYHTETTNALWIDFTAWCRPRNADPGKRTSFNDRLVNCGISKPNRKRIDGGKNPETVCIGVKLNSRESDGEKE